MSPDPLDPSRRYFLGQCTGLSLGAMALSTLVGRALAADSPGKPGLPHLPHFAAKAKRVIFLTQSGGPSQIELFDEKPGLTALAGTELPESVRRGQRLTTMTSGQKQLIKPAATKFERCGQSGQNLGEWLPHLKTVADDLCVIRSMHTDQINHAPAMTQFLTGNQIPGRPSLGAWASYGLGSENRNLPDYLVLLSKMQRPSDQPLYDHYWGSGFLPSRYQGVKLRSAKDPVLYLRDPDGLPRELRREMLDTLGALNQQALARSGDPEVSTRIRQYEMAYRMQTAVPEVMDLSKESDDIVKLYGPDCLVPGTFAANCLLARKLSENGVRFVQLYHQGWDQHGNLPFEIKSQAKDVDQASAALVTDLKQRGLLDETLVIWGGEFGRTSYSQGKLTPENYGRDHHPRCFSIWMAGGGIKPGMVYGETDELGYNIIKNPVHVHDFQATVLHTLGLNHEKLIFKHLGRRYRLTDISGKVVRDILS